MMMGSQSESTQAALWQSCPQAPQFDGSSAELTHSPPQQSVGLAHPSHGMVPELLEFVVEGWPVVESLLVVLPLVGSPLLAAPVTSSNTTLPPQPLCMSAQSNIDASRAKQGFTRVPIYSTTLSGQSMTHWARAAQGLSFQQLAKNPV